MICFYLSSKVIYHIGALCGVLYSDLFFPGYLRCLQEQYIHTSHANSGRGQICSSADLIKYDAEISSKLSGNHLPAINDQHSLSVTSRQLNLTKIQFEIPTPYYPDSIEFIHSKKNFLKVTRITFLLLRFAILFGKSESLLLFVALFFSVF